MINGLLTLRGAWDKVRVEPVLKFFVVAITGYGMATLKDQCYHLKRKMLLRIYRLDYCACSRRCFSNVYGFFWIYWLVPRMTKGPLFSKLANFHSG
jgi:cytochrome c oxidase cbb3-type subunit I/II